MSAKAVRFNRAVFVFGAVGLSVAGSRVASDPWEYVSWFIVLASVDLLVVADVGREIDQVASVLANSSGVEITRARRDVVRARAPRWLPWGLVAAALLVVAAVLVLLLTAGRVHHKPAAESESRARVARVAECL